MSFEAIPHRLRFFVHPIPLAAVIVMALNDHWLKYSFGNWVTGKLSDFCGLFYFPIFLLALAALVDEVFEWRRFKLGPFSTVVAIGFSDLLLILVKLSPRMAETVEIFFNQYLFRIQLVQDPTDLLALLINPLTFFYLKNYWAISKVT